LFAAFSKLGKRVLQIGCDPKHRITVIEGMLAKGFGMVDGYIAGSAAMCDFIRAASEIQFGGARAAAGRRVPRGTERLRITPSPLHTTDDIRLRDGAPSDVWAELSLRCAALRERKLWRERR